MRAGATRRLADLASVIRSKNAGPFAVTLDVLFDTSERYQQVVAAGVITPAVIAGRYGVDPDQVRVIAFPPANAIKVTLPRRVPSGSPGDTDVYGTQQHTPLLELEVPDVGPSRGRP